ncbi:MAG: hypothetical protein ACXWIU_05990, partial [Limisphaerales bacterium]
MTAPNPIPAGPDLDKQRHATYPKSLPKIPETWRASILLSPFGDSSSPLPIYSQLVVGTIEYSYTQTESWMRVGLYLTQSKQYFEFVFITVVDDKKEVHRNWYWIDSTPNGRISNIYGPFQTTLQVPWPNFFQDRSTLWGNAYPLMCTDTNSKGINCEHWVLPTPAPRGGHPDHGSWFTFRKDTGSKKDTRNLFRVLMTDATNPLMIPILGSYFFTNLPTFRAGEVSDTSNALIERIRGGEAKARADYWNPMVTQEDIHRAMAFPLASADCTPRDIEAVIPGFIAPPIDGELPLWSPKTYIEGWTIGTDFVPYFTRVCYLWTGDADSKQQSVFVGLGSAPGQSTYLNRKDACLNTKGVTPVIYKWNPGTDFWEKNECRKSDTGLVRPDWVARGGGVIMGKIRGNPDFGLAEDQTIELI